MKKIILGIGLFIMVIALSPKAYANSNVFQSSTCLSGCFNVLPFDAFYMVDSVGSFTQQPDDPFNPQGMSHYSSDQIPVLFMQVPIAGSWGGAFTQAWIDYTLYKDGAPVLHGALSGPNGQRQFWVDFGNPGSWNSDGQGNPLKNGSWFDIRDSEHSIWSIYASYLENEGCDHVASGEGLTAFTTPEPVSSSLFLFGASILSIRRLRKKQPNKLGRS